MMGLSVGELVADLGLNTRGFDLKLAGAGSSVRSGLGGALKGLVPIAATAMAAVGAAVAATVVKGVKDFAEFDKSMREVFTLLPGISQTAMGVMSQDVKDFAVEFGVLPDEVVPALYQSLSAGVPKDNVFEFMETAQKAAKGGVTELETAVDGLSSVVNAYGKDVIDATKTSDLMFTAVKLGKTTFEELSASLFNVIPTAAGIGVAFDDVTAAIAAMTAQGTPTSVATTQLRQMFVELSKAGSDTAEVFEEIAGKSFREFVRGGGNTQQALRLLEKHAKDTGVGVNDLFGSVEAGSAALALTGKGAKTFAKDLKAMEDSAGATEEAYETMDEGLSASWGRIKSTFAVALIDIGEAVAPVAEELAKDFAGGLRGLGEWISAHQGEITTFFSEMAQFVGDAVSAVQAMIQPLLDLYNGLSDLMGLSEQAVAGMEETMKGVQPTLDAHAWMATTQDVVAGIDILEGAYADLVRELEKDPGLAEDWDFQTNLDNITRALGEWQAEYDERMGKGAEDSREHGEAFSAELADGLLSNLDSVEDSATDVGAAGRDSAASGLGDGSKPGGFFGGKLASGIGSKKGAARSAGAGLGSAGRGGASAAIGSGFGIGVSFGTGFANGISSTANSAYRSAAAVAQAAAAGIKTTGHVESPSKLMRDLGQFYGKGFELGLRDMVGDVQRAARSVGQAGLGVGVPGGVGAGSPGAARGALIVEFNSCRFGHDPGEISDAVFDAGVALGVAEART